MRIAFVHEIWEAGATRCVRDLERELGQRHEVTFFPREGLDTAESILNALQSFRPDIVHCHSFYSNLPYSFLPRVSKCYPTCFTIHDPRPIGTIEIPCWDCDRNTWCLRCPMLSGRWRKLLANRYMRQRQWKRLQHMLCARDLRIVCPSDWIRKRLEAQELARFEMRTIPYGIDLKHFQRIPEARQRLGLPAGVPIVLHLSAFVGKSFYSIRKGLGYLDDAFATTVLPRVPDAILAVAGEDVAPNRPWVRPMGIKIPVKDLPMLLSAVDVFVAATLADNLPYTVIEAMGCELPVVASTVGGLPEEVAEGVTGLLVPPRDHVALGEALVTLLTDPDRLRAFGMAGRARAEELFDMTDFVAAYESLFEEMIADRSSRTRPTPSRHRRTAETGRLSR
jgi:glycosyltransferase involved in cell wall biosynthesis